MIKRVPLPRGGAITLKYCEADFQQVEEDYYASRDKGRVVFKDSAGVLSEVDSPPSDPGR
mgnify:CR=1 FL=1